MSYLFTVTVGLCLSYFGILYLFSYFFTGKGAPVPKRWYFSLALIIILSIVGYTIVELIPDVEWGNRFLHFFGGGVLSFIVCYLVLRDSGLPIARFQFIILSLLIVTALGVANEVMEYALEHVTGLVFAPNIEDTWHDLISNSLGALLPAAILTPMLGEKK